MVEQSSVFPLLAPCTSEDEFYQSGLNACIEGIKNFPVNKRQNTTGIHSTINSFAKRAVTSPTHAEPSHFLPSPPPSPLQSPKRQMWPSPPPSSPSVTASMNRSLLHGGPVRGNAGPLHGRQDARSPQNARSNLTIQPAANAGIFKLKKNAVKIVSAAGPAPNAPLPRAPPQPAGPAVMSLSTPISSPAPGSAHTQQMSNKKNETPEVLKAAVKPHPVASVLAYPPSNIKLPTQTLDAKGSLDDMFARLSAATASVPSRPARELSPVGPDNSMLFFEDRLGGSTAATKASGGSTSSGTRAQPYLAFLPQSSPQVQDKPTQPQPTPETQKALSSMSLHDMSQDELEQEYLRKATEYISVLPPGINNSAHAIKTVGVKLQNAYTPDTRTLSHNEVEKLQACYVFAVVTYANKKVKLIPGPLTGDFVKKVLRDSNGNFLRLCAALVDNGYIALDSLEEITGLCKTILDVLPKANEKLATQAKELSADASSTSLAASTSPADDESKITSGDLLDGTKAWPTQEKREHGAIYRACILKGVSGAKSLNELQALVWGGRLESISMPEPGSDHALVKFLTPKACQTYLDATENGIEVQGGTKKTIIFVDKQSGPNSINDVIQNCIDGDASRCVRATGADDDWSDGALLKLARGKQQAKRDVDRIKQGKTPRGHHWIEFRFGNIYHALNFRRYLMNDEEWEHCFIGYAPDPCELARGVHYKDADEERDGFVA